MTDPRIDEVASAVERRFPGTKVVVRPCPSPEDPDIESMLFVTGCSPADEDELGRFTLELGVRLFGETSIPFLALAVTPQWIERNDARAADSAHARR